MRSLLVFRCSLSVGQGPQHDSFPAYPPNGDMTLTAWISRIGPMAFAYSTHSVEYAERLARMEFEVAGAETA